MAAAADQKQAKGIGVDVGGLKFAAAVRTAQVGGEPHSPVADESVRCCWY
jgi:hypothetical protein